MKSFPLDNIQNTEHILYTLYGMYVYGKPLQWEVNTENLLTFTDIS